MKPTVKYTCSHNVLITLSKTLAKEISDYSDKKIEPDEVSKEENRMFTFFHRPNSFFNKILSEITIPKEHRDTLRINNINSISISVVGLTPLESVFVFFNEAFEDLSKGVEIIASTEYMGEI